LENRSNETVIIACQCGNVFQVEKDKYLNFSIQCPACKTEIQPADHFEGNKNE
jgi:predicted Zn-ribbon and HTH transcriptional regulator